MTDSNPSIAVPGEAAEQGMKILGFLCNWCSYGGADTAGVCRFKQPTDLRIVRIPCTGRMDPLFVAKPLIYGVDGVLVSGCHPKDCHYAVGNLYARRRLELMKGFLPFMGIDARRFHYTWVSASEGQRWQQVVTEFSEQIHRLGPNSGVRKQPGENLYTLDGLKQAAIPCTA